ncbi:unnamed protein product [Pedinophyceae sp. YPF-701]|nr:unnamed protein product [Pedinophyceae sp. YPF-701]
MNRNASPSTRSRPPRGPGAQARGSSAATTDGAGSTAKGSVGNGAGGAPSASAGSPAGASPAPPSDAKVCANCHTTSTPLWRKDKQTGTLMCNACGIYFKNHGRHRPVELAQGQQQRREDHHGAGDEDGADADDNGATSPQQPLKSRLRAKRSAGINHLAYPGELSDDGEDKPAAQPGVGAGAPRGRQPRRNSLGATQLPRRRRRRGSGRRRRSRPRTRRSSRATRPRRSRRASGPSPTRTPTATS